MEQRIRQSFAMQPITRCRVRGCAEPAECPSPWWSLAWRGWHKSWHPRRGRRGTLQQPAIQTEWLENSANDITSLVTGHIFHYVCTALIELKKNLKWEMMTYLLKAFDCARLPPELADEVQWSNIIGYILHLNKWKSIIQQDAQIFCNTPFQLQS